MRVIYLFIFSLIYFFSSVWQNGSLIQKLRKKTKKKIQEGKKIAIVESRSIWNLDSFNFGYPQEYPASHAVSVHQDKIGGSPEHVHSAQRATIKNPIPITKLYLYIYVKLKL